MNQNIAFGILVLILLFIGNEVSQVKRRLAKLDEQIGHLQITFDLMRNTVPEEIRSTIKHEIQMHEIRTSN